ncbi:MAG TPA: hypothetical protein VIP78_14010, partial [Candidatus Dormibacteraeota bacterium]
FFVEPRLVAHAQSLGIEAVSSERPPSVPAYPEPRTDGEPLLVASYGDIKVGRRLGYGPFAFIEHGAGQSYAGDPRWVNQLISGSYAGGPDRDDVELFMVPNSHAADRWRAAYPDARVELVGCPKLDALPRRELAPGPVVAISFHFQAPMSLGPEAQTALGEYLPVLADLAARFMTIGHAHPKADWPARMERIYRKAGIPFVANFDDVCRQADVYVCDNSSTIFEFASTGRPVVVLNSKFYRRDIHHGLRYWEAATVGMQVDRPEDLIAIVEAALGDPVSQQQAREAALNIVYQPRTNGAAYAATAISDWLASRQKAAA